MLVFAIFTAIWAALVAAVRPRAGLVLEVLVLRQQVAVLSRDRPRPPLREADRAFWIFMSRVWSRWADLLVIVKPATVVGWHKRGFRWFWTRKCRGRGRQPVAPEVVELIQKLRGDNPLWGARRIRDELARLGIEVGKDTVLKHSPPRPIAPRPQRRLSGTWMTFLRNHVTSIVSIDFFTVPTATFRVLYGFVVLAHDRRRVLHVNVTANPSAQWAAQQVVEAIGLMDNVRRLLRDRDGTYGEEFVRRVSNLGVEHLLSSPRSPWQNPYVERFIGTIRRELLDHVVVCDEDHLLRMMKAYVRYYNEDRTHLSLAGDVPAGRAIEPRESGEVVALPRVGGLHHRYVRKRAA